MTDSGLLEEVMEDTLLNEYARQVELEHGDAAASAVRKLWTYLSTTPGEQFPYAKFAQDLGVGPQQARKKMLMLAQKKVITQTIVRRGSGGGVGFVCDWLEARRNGVSGADGQTQHGSNAEHTSEANAMLDTLLDGFEKIVSERSKGRTRTKNIETIRALWPYLTETPGARKPWKEFGAMLGMSS